nr:putative integron gene cassette protein [uncultured bacterium]
MRNLIALIPFLLLLIGCQRQNIGPIPDCFPNTPTTAQLTVPEQKALADAKSRLKSSCNDVNTQCSFSSRTNTDGSIRVFIQFASFDGSPPRCGYPVGGHQLETYTASGEFVDSMPGL